LLFNKVAALTDIFRYLTVEEQTKF